MSDLIRGRVWLFGDDVNTDVMMPGAVLYATEEQQTNALFAPLRPGWVNEARRGDIIIAGRNFGVGSSRPAARSLVNVGIACLVADSINTLFFRACVGYGLVAVNCPGAAQFAREGDEIEVDAASGVLRHARTGGELRGQPTPPDLLAIMRAGGMLPAMEAEGLISGPRTPG